MQIQVVFDILTEARTASSLGASRSDLQNQTVVVEAQSTIQAQRQVEAMYGGSQNVLVRYAQPLR